MPSNAQLLYETHLTPTQIDMAENWLHQGRSIQWISRQFRCEPRFVQSLQRELFKCRYDPNEPAIPPGNEERFSELMHNVKFSEIKVSRTFRARLPGYVTVTNDGSPVRSSGDYYLSESEEDHLSYERCKSNGYIAPKRKKDMH